MSPCVPTIETSRPGGCHQPAMAFSPPFLPRPDFPLPGMLQVLKKKSCFCFFLGFSEIEIIAEKRGRIDSRKWCFQSICTPCTFSREIALATESSGYTTLFFFHPRHGGFPRQFEMVISSRNPGLLALVDAWLSWPGPYQLLRHPLW